MVLLTYTFPVVAERTYLPVAVLAGFLLVGLWLLTHARAEGLRLGGLNLALASAAVAVLLLWTLAQTSPERRFHTIEVGTDQVRLSFADPAEVLLLPQAEIAAVGFDVISYVRSPDVRCTLQITTTSGKAFVSQYRMDQSCKRYRGEVVRVLGR